MAAMDAHILLVYPLLLGVASHLGWFMHGEHHNWTMIYFQAFFGLPPLGLAALVYRGSTFSAALVTTFLVTTAYLTGLYASTLIYRGLFHRLRRFPGPPLAKYSELWHVWKASIKNRNFEDIDQLHAIYGDFVRIGTVLSLRGTPRRGC